MKKKIIVILEVESDDNSMLSEEYIRNDLATEINCASNCYDVISVQVNDTE